MLGKVSYGGVTTPIGFRAAAANANIKGKNLERVDCGLIYSDNPCVYAGVFTSNVVKAAPVLYDMELLSKKAQAYKEVSIAIDNIPDGFVETIRGIKTSIKSYIETLDEIKKVENENFYKAGFKDAINLVTECLYSHIDIENKEEI